MDSFIESDSLIIKNNSVLLSCTTGKNCTVKNRIYFTKSMNTSNYNVSLSVSQLIFNTSQ
jgi:hypothetical protein